jgi:CO dehydrogenase maturation factor
MKLAVAGKGGVGKTSITAWLGDWLARQGQDVWLVDADTALSLGQACGLSRTELPVPLIEREDLVRERIGSGMISLSPQVDDLPEALSVELPGQGPGRKRLLVMGSVSRAGGGCACAANALLKALLLHLVVERGAWVLVDLEAGVEHLGRGTVAHVDGLLMVSDPSWRGLETAAEIRRMAVGLGLATTALAINRLPAGTEPPKFPGLPEQVLTFPCLEGLSRRQLSSPSVLGLPEQAAIDAFCSQAVEMLSSGRR